MIAVILVGGKGKRLGVLSKFFPKSLLWLPGGTIIERQINSLINLGVTKVVICGASRAKQKWIQCLSKAFNQIDCTIADIHCKNMLFDLSCCMEFDNENFIVLHGDNIFAEDLNYIVEYTKRSEMAVLVAPQNHMPGYPIYFQGEDGCLNIPKSQTEVEESVVILGCYYISSRMVSILKFLVKKHSAKTPIDLINYLIRCDKKVKGVALVGRHYNINTVRDLYNVSINILDKIYKNNRECTDQKHKANNKFFDPFWVDSNVKIQKSSIGPNVAIAEDCKIDSSHIENSVVFPGSIISNQNIKNLIVTPFIQIKVCETI